MISPPLYRAFLREARKLPHVYLRQFWRIKASDDARAILKTEITHVRENKIKRFTKYLRKLEAANAQHYLAFDYVLNIAYGRKGKLKRELMESILSDPKAPIPPRIIPAVESSRPPIYSKELKALLTSAASRTTKALPEAHLTFPPTLPPRANPASEDARLLGPFSKRREVNIRWRYFVAESRKLRLPLQVVVDHREHVSSSAVEDVRRAEIRTLPMQGLRVFEDVETLAAGGGKPHVTRWVRRRYQNLLNRLPILTYNPPQKKYSVSLSQHRLDKEARVADADASDLLWMQSDPNPPRPP